LRASAITEYSRRSWVRFLPGRAPERLNTRVIDALKQMNFGRGGVAARAVTADAIRQRSRVRPIVSQRV
jgi:hypothetical protein